MPALAQRLLWPFRPMAAGGLRRAVAGVPRVVELPGGRLTCMCCPQAATCLRNLSPTWQSTCTQSPGPMSTTAQPAGGSAQSHWRVPTTGPIPSSLPRGELCGLAWQGRASWVSFARVAGPMGTASSEGTGPGMDSGPLTSDLAEPGLSSTAPSSPRTGDQAGSYHLNLTSHFRWSALKVSVGLYTSLCQYFSEENMVWRTEGLLPLEETSPHQAVCLTRHLTAFGASLFVPPSHVHFVFPVSGPVLLGAFAGLRRAWVGSALSREGAACT